MDNSFAIAVENVLAMPLIEGDEGFNIKRGMMVEIKKHSSRYSTITIHDYYDKNLSFEINNLYLCKSSALFPVSREIWPFLTAIMDPCERANLAKDKGLVDYILSLEVSCYATVRGQEFNVSSINQSLMFLPEREPRERLLDYECIIRHIGEVDEIGPGYYFGLELLVNLRKSYL